MKKKAYTAPCVRHTAMDTLQLIAESLFGSNPGQTNDDDLPSIEVPEDLEVRQDFNVWDNEW